jgi:hypothetical protein
MKNQIAMPGPKPGPKVSGGALPSKTDNGRPAPIPKVAAAPSPREHISEGIRANLGGLSPELAKGIRRVADNKVPRPRDPR